MNEILPTNDLHVNPVAIFVDDEPVTFGECERRIARDRTIVLCPQCSSPRQWHYHSAAYKNMIES